jgi:hypothetical protein
MLTLHEWDQLLDKPSGYYVVRIGRHWSVAYWVRESEKWLLFSSRKKRRISYDADYFDEVAERVS